MRELLKNIVDDKKMTTKEKTKKLKQVCAKKPFGSHVICNSTVSRMTYITHKCTSYNLLNEIIYNLHNRISLFTFRELSTLSQREDNCNFIDNSVANITLISVN